MKLLVHPPGVVLGGEEACLSEAFRPFGMSMDACIVMDSVATH